MVWKKKETEQEKNKTFWSQRDAVATRRRAPEVAFFSASEAPFDRWRARSTVSTALINALNASATGPDRTLTSVPPVDDPLASIMAYWYLFMCVCVCSIQRSAEQGR